MTHADLESYKAITQPALKGTYHNRTIYTTHAPSAGPVLIHLLNVLEKYDFHKGERDGLSTHRFIEALKCKFHIVTLRWDGQLGLIVIHFNIASRICAAYKSWRSSIRAGSRRACENDHVESLCRRDTQENHRCECCIVNMATGSDTY